MSLTRKVLECRDIISRMQVQEVLLLKHRTSDAQQLTYRSLISGVVFLLVSLTVVLILFGFLLRDARKAIETDKQIFDANERMGVTVKTLEDQAKENSPADFAAPGTAVMLDTGRNVSDHSAAHRAGGAIGKDCSPRCQQYSTIA